MSLAVASEVARNADLPLSEQAYRYLRDQLIMLEIRPGDAINDLLVAGQLSIGRTPVREALKRLESDHLVISYPRRGTFATRVDITELAHLTCVGHTSTEIRELLEPLAARRAARTATPDMRARLQELAVDIATSDHEHADHPTLMRYDIMVHRQIYAAAANPHLEDVLIRYDNLATRIWCLVLDKIPSVAGHISEHVNLLQAIANGDAELAGKLALEHVTSFEKTIREVL